MTWTCALCAADIDDTTSLVSHFNELHPGTLGEFDTWPDGELVVLDDTISPSDFQDHPGNSG